VRRIEINRNAAMRSSKMPKTNWNGRRMAQSVVQHVLLLASSMWDFRESRRSLRSSMSSSFWSLDVTFLPLMYFALRVRWCSRFVESSSDT